MTVLIYLPVTDNFPGGAPAKDPAIKVTSSEGLLQWTETKDAPFTLPFTRMGGHRPRERLTIADKDQLNEQCRPREHPWGEWMCHCIWWPSWLDIPVIDSSIFFGHSPSSLLFRPDKRNRLRRGRSPIKRGSDNCVGPEWVIWYLDDGIVNVLGDLRLRSHMAIVHWALSTEGAKSGNNDA